MVFFLNQMNESIEKKKRVINFEECPHNLFIAYRSPY